MTMPFDVQVALQGNSNLPEDRWTNVLHFDGAFGESQADELWSHYVTWLTAAGAALAQNGHTIKVYEPGANPGGPVFAKTYSISGLVAPGLPHEVAICLSYATVDDPDASLPRRRGRIFLGPLKISQVTNGLPSAGLIDAVLDLGEAIATVGTASETTWVMYSQRDASYHKIESIWTDNAFDTQRRRGIAPTARTVRDVQ